MARNFLVFYALSLIILIIMCETQEDLLNEFNASARTGRRNAVPEVDVQGIDSEAIKLTERISNMEVCAANDTSSTTNTSNLQTGFTVFFRSSFSFKFKFFNFLHFYCIDFH